MRKLYYNVKSIAKFLGIIAILFLLSPLVTKAQDLPNPPANLQTIPAGSFVIPMDTDLQSIVPAGQAPFNLKAYGLVNELLQNGIPVKWAIASGKQKDAIDFTATAERYAPGVTAAASIDFRGGPFIVPDTVLPCGQSTAQVISSFGNNVAVYRLTNNTNADIRYTLIHRPKIAVFNNGNNQAIHTKILDAAGIDDYDVMSAEDIADLANCYTFASEPHADVEQVSQGMIDGVRAFVLNGGNFLAQCAAVEAYENRGFYQTTAGLTIINTTVSQQFPNPDLAFTQMHGGMLENAGGTVDNWTPSAGSNWHPYTYKSVTFNSLDTVVAMGAHLIAPTAPGGNVFYLGGHDYARNGPPSNPPNLSSIERINALRAYLNVAFIPSGTSSGAWAEAGPPSLSIGCSESVVLGCEQTGPLGATFLWTPSTGLSCTTCPNPVANPSVTTTYTVQVTNGCLAMDTIQVLVGTKPIAQFTNTTVCQGIATSFTDQSVGSTYRLWNFGDPASESLNTSNLPNPTHIFSSHGSYAVTLISGPDPLCADTIVQTVVVDPLPVVTVTSLVICSGETATLTAGGADSYIWSTGETTASISAIPNITTTYTVTGTSAGCSNIATANVTVIPPLTPVVSAADAICFGGDNGSATVSMNGDGVYFYNWNTSPVQTTAQATGLNAGTYTVTVTDTNSCTATGTATISEPPALVLTTNAADVTCFGGNNGSATVSVTGGVAPYTYSWNTNPVQLTTEATGLTAGSYSVVVTDINGCTETTSASIVEPPAVILSASVVPVSCNGGSNGSATVSVSGGASPYLYSWNTTPEQTNAQANNLAAGDYTVTVTDDNHCVYTALATVSEPEPISINTVYTNPSCLQGGTADASVTGGTFPYTFQWNSGPVLATSFVSDLTAGDYNVIVTDANGCQEHESITLLNPPIPVADFTYTSWCVGGTSVFTDRSVIQAGTIASSIVSWSWDFGEPASGVANVAIGTNPEHTYNAAGTYQTRLIVMTDLGCQDTIIKPVVVYPLPEVRFGSTGGGCEKVCVTFSDSSTIAVGAIQSWSWDFGDATSQNNTSDSQNPQHCYNSAGSYNVSLTVTSDRGCSASSVRENMIGVYSNPVVELGPDLKICTEDQTKQQITVQSIQNAGPGSEFLWDPIGENAQTITVTQPGIYTLTVTNEWGCKASDVINLNAYR